MHTMSGARFTLDLTVGKNDIAEAVDYLAAHSGLSKSAVKDAMNKGAVWLTRRGERKRLRRATAALVPGDRLQLFYDRDLLSFNPPPARLIHDACRYSVWFKPAGMLAQGTDAGDHAALTRHAEKALARPVFPVHRLDREALGLMVLAHDREAAARLSALFAGNDVAKHYRVQVRGQLQGEGRIEQPLDGKSARTDYRVLAYDAAGDVTTVEVRLHSGRLHQIRRHMAAPGHGVMGDPRYGTGNKNREGLRLAAVRRSFTDPFTRELRTFAVEPEWVGF
ncbi:MAG: RluA family pseudouridine synthase [Thiohalomonadaceae bacterium]